MPSHSPLPSSLQALRALDDDDVTVLIVKNGDCRHWTLHDVIHVIDEMMEQLSSQTEASATTAAAAVVMAQREGDVRNRPGSPVVAVAQFPYTPPDAASRGKRGGSMKRNLDSEGDICNSYSSCSMSQPSQLSDGVGDNSNGSSSNSSSSSSQEQPARKRKLALIPSSSSSSSSSNNSGNYARGAIDLTDETGHGSHSMKHKHTNS